MNDSDAKPFPKVTYTLDIELAGRWTFNLLEIKYIYETSAAGNAFLLIGIEGRASDLSIKYNRNDLNKEKIKKFISTFEDIHQMAFLDSLDI